jgi:hypothetical protein
LVLISIRKSTRRRLKALRLSKRESYDEIINRLIKAYVHAENIPKAKVEPSPTAGENLLVERIRELSERLRLLETKISFSSVRRTEEVRTVMEGSAPAQETVGDQSLPSFLKGNPWVEILSERGKEKQKLL